MDKQDINSIEYFTIDIVHLVKSLLHRVWIIALTGLITGAITFSIFAFVVAPKYSSSIMLYVNNSSFSLGNTSFSISSSEITAAQSLVKTYGEILNNRTTLERVIDKTKVPYDYEDLSKMVSSSLSNNTEIMKVTVTSEDPYEAAKIANCIAEILPIRISEIIDGASMEVVDSAVPNMKKVSPSITKNTVIGILFGFILAASAIAVLTILDDTIHDEEYVIRTYDYPILAKIPNLLNTESKESDYYYYGDSKPKAKM
jgi:capsular polysaccharide biosynthesis protein